MSSSPQSPIFSTMSSDSDMLELVEEFVDALTDRVVLLEKALAAHDLAELTRLAHQLKGSCGGYGFDSIGERAASLEQSAKVTGSIADMTTEAEELISMCRRATAEPSSSD